MRVLAVADADRGGEAGQFDAFVSEVPPLWLLLRKRGWVSKGYEPCVVAGELRDLPGHTVPTCRNPWLNTL